MVVCPNVTAVWVVIPEPAASRTVVIDTRADRSGFMAHHLPGALYAPPTHRRFWFQWSYLWEKVGRRFDPRQVAGALLVEASKQVYARPPRGSKVTIPGPLEVLGGLAGGAAR